MRILYTESSLGIETNIKQSKSSSTLSLWHAYLQDINEWVIPKSNSTKAQCKNKIRILVTTSRKAPTSSMVRAKILTGAIKSQVRCLGYKSYKYRTLTCLVAGLATPKASISALQIFSKVHFTTSLAGRTSHYGMLLMMRPSCQNWSRRDQCVTMHWPLTLALVGWLKRPISLIKFFHLIMKVIF